MNKQLLTLVIAGLTFAFANASQPTRSTEVSKYLQWRQQQGYPAQRGARVTAVKAAAVQRGPAIRPSRTTEMEEEGTLMSSRNEPGYGRNEPAFGRGEAEKAMEQRGEEVRK